MGNYADVITTITPTSYNYVYQDDGKGQQTSSGSIPTENVSNSTYVSPTTGAVINLVSDSEYKSAETQNIYTPDLEGTGYTDVVSGIDYASHQYVSQEVVADQAPDGAYETINAPDDTVRINTPGLVTKPNGSFTYQSSNWVDIGSGSGITDLPNFPNDARLQSISNWWNDGGAEQAVKGHLNGLLDTVHSHYPKLGSAMDSYQAITGQNFDRLGTEASLGANLTKSAKLLASATGTTLDSAAKASLEFEGKLQDIAGDLVKSAGESLSEIRHNVQGIGTAIIDYVHELDPFNKIKNFTVIEHH